MFSAVTSNTHALQQVAAGPGRSVYLVVALVAGIFVWMRRPDPVELIWIGGFVLAARCYFEAVMTPYYLMPPLIVLLAMAARRGTWRFIGSCATAGAVSWFAYWHLDPWIWWLPVVAGTTVVMVLSFPERPTSDQHCSQAFRSTDGREPGRSADVANLQEVLIT